MTNTNEWITWQGGECPVDGDTLVEVEFRDGSSFETGAKNLRWDSKRTWDGDIIRYRLKFVEQTSVNPDQSADRAIWRQYACAALTGLVPMITKIYPTKDALDDVKGFADAMLAAEKERWG